MFQLTVLWSKGFAKTKTQEELIDEACELLEKWDGNGGSPNDRMYNEVIQGLLQHDETSKAMKHLQIMVDKGFFPANATNASMLVELLSAIQEIKQCKNYFNNLYEGF